MQGYTVVDLGGDRLESGYPIVRLAAPEVTAEQWMDHARAVRRHGGILGLCSANDMLFGLATYQRHQTLRLGAALFVDLFAVFELSRSGAGRRALLDGVEARAERLGCSTLLLTGQGDARTFDARQGWIATGYQLHSTVLSKTANSSAAPTQSRFGIALA